MIGAPDPVAVTPGEALVLAALIDGEWQTSAALVDETGLLAPAVRLALRTLRARGCVQRSLRGAWQAVPSTAVGLADAIPRSLP